MIGAKERFIDESGVTGDVGNDGFGDNLAKTNRDRVPDQPSHSCKRRKLFFWQELDMIQGYAASPKPNRIRQPCSVGENQRG